MEQVLRNLISNAVKYGEGRPIDVTIRDGDPVRVAVTDRGIGISAEDIERIFERFERAVPVRRFGGFGVGLWVARTVVQAMGGAIRVESAPGAGSTFTIELPRAAGAPAAHEAVP